MRTLPFAATLALVLLLALPASAQVPPANYSVEIRDRPAGPLLPGATATYNLTATRTCGNSFDILDATAVDIKLGAEANLTVTGPGKVQFPSQFCAQQPQATVDFQVQVYVAAGAQPRVYLVNVHLWPGNSGALPRFSQDANTDFAVPVVQPEPKVVPESAAKASPAVGPMLGVAVLSLAALVGRRAD